MPKIWPHAQKVDSDPKTNAVHRPTEPEQRPSTRASVELVLSLSSAKFLMCWWMVAGFRVCEIAFLTGSTWLYQWLLHDPAATASMLDNVHFEMTYATLDVMSWSFAVVAGLHALMFSRTLVRSFKARECAFEKGFSLSSVSTSSFFTFRSHDRFTRHKSPRECSFRQGMLRRVVKTMQRAKHLLFSIYDQYFDDLFLLNECLEVASQIYQARQMSVYIATRWINNVFVGMILVNCISTPLIHRLIPASRIASRRLCEISMSTLLNFVNSVVIPLVIFMEYARDYDHNIHYFPYAKLFDDIWWVKAIRENQQLFVTSPVDFVSALWPHISFFNCLVMCESMIAREHDVSRPKMTVIGPIGRKPKSPKVARAQRKLREQSHSILRTLLCLAGIVVLVVHIDAQEVPQVASCKLQATPWLSGNKTSCVVMNLNCYRLKIQGNNDEISHVLSQLNRAALLTLIITHCRALEVPPVVREFHELNGIEIYNSSLADWPMESALVEQDFPVLEYVYILRSNLSRIPEPLVRNPMPSFLGEMVFIETKISSLPGELKDSWKGIQCIRLERCELPEIPEVLAEIQPPYLDLIGNPIQNTTLDLFANDEMLSLLLSGVPLTQLPDQTSGKLTQMFRLLLEHTELQEVPMFIQQWFHRNMEQGNYVVHSLFGSPFCNKSIPEGEKHQQEREYQQQVCSTEFGTTTGVFPIGTVAPQRSL